jgi:hypothetical protein
MIVERHIAIAPSLISGKNLSCDSIYTDSLGNRIGHRLGLSANHRDPNAKAMKLLDGLFGFGADLVLGV